MKRLISYRAALVCSLPLASMAALIACSSSDDTTNNIGTTSTSDAGKSDSSSTTINVGSDGGTIITTPPGASGFLVGGTITGLAKGSSVVLQDNGGDNLTISSNGTFQFATAVAKGAAYAVSVLTPPGSPAESCMVTNGSGTIGTADVGDVQINCTASAYTVAVTVTGVSGTGLVLQDNGGDDLAVSDEGTVTFGKSLQSGATYDVTVKTQPTGPAQTCAVGGGSGTVGSGNITSVTVNCGVNAFVVGGTISGLFGTGLVLEDNNGDDLAINTTNGTFAFPTPVADGQTYNVTVKTQPSMPNQICSITGTSGGGTIMSANVSSVAVTCAASYAVGGNVVGLATGDSVVVQDNNGDSTTLSGNGPFTFPTTLTHGSAYSVTVLTNPTTPTAQTCTVDQTGSAGTIAYADVSSVTIRCASAYYVNVATGSDTANDGTTAATAWKTITHAIATVPTTGATINVAPGTYNAPAGETFPITAKSYQTFVGDVANKGLGATPTVVTGGGGYTAAGGDLAISLSYAFVVPSTAVNVSVSGLSFSGNAGYEGILTDKASATFDSITTSFFNVSFLLGNGANVHLTNSVINSSGAGVYIADPTTVFYARGNTFGPASASSFYAGPTSTVTGSNIDLGTTASPGNNTIVSTSSSYGLYLIHVDSSTVNAVGNTWKASVQGADANGHYATATITGPVAPVGGNNYAILGTTKLQF